MSITSVLVSSKNYLLLCIPWLIWGQDCEVNFIHNSDRSALEKGVLLVTFIKPGMTEEQVDRVLRTSRDTMSVFGDSWYPICSYIDLGITVHYDNDWQVRWAKVKPARAAVPERIQGEKVDE